LKRRKNRKRWGVFTEKMLRFQRKHGGVTEEMASQGFAKGYPNGNSNQSEFAKKSEDLCI